MGSWGKLALVRLSLALFFSSFFFSISIFTPTRLRLESFLLLFVLFSVRVTWQELFLRNLEDWPKKRQESIGKGARAPRKSGPRFFPADNYYTTQAEEKRRGKKAHAQMHSQMHALPARAWRGTAGSRLQKGKSAQGEKRDKVIVSDTDRRRPTASRGTGWRGGKERRTGG